VIAQWESPGGGLGRVIREQAEKLAAECQAAHETPEVFAHKARVRCKKIRAALRLAEPLLGGKAYRRENRWWRDAARELSELRDMTARIEAVEALEPFLTARIGTAMMRRLNERFEKERRAMDAGAAIAAFRARMAERGAEFAPPLPLGEREEMAKALAQTYREARRSMKAALKDEDPLLIHEWRKQTKYHALQTRLMRMTFPEMLQDRTGAARELAELLGSVQDIEVVLESGKDWDGAPEGFEEGLKDKRKALIEDAERAGEKLFADKPKAWATRLLDPPAHQPLDREEAEADL
jgi:hypothetical protein